MPDTVQTLDARYIDGEKLLALLKRLFGTGSFKVNVRPPFPLYPRFSLWVARAAISSSIASEP